MKNKAIFCIFIFTAILSLSALNCSSGGTSKVTIRINLGSSEHAFYSPVRSIFNRFLSFFEKEAAAAMLSNIVSLELNVSGDGMDSIHQSYSTPLPSSVSVEVPSGSERLFELLAHTPSVTFRGTATKDLAGGETVDLPITMRLYETKIIIPDYNNQRIVQIDNMTGNGWIAKNGTDISFAGTFRPSDIDFDNQGKAYIAVAGFTTNEGKIIRIDDISVTSCTTLITIGGPAINTIAIDRVNNYIYYIDGSTLYKTNIDGTPIGSGISLSPFMTINGIAVDPQGKVYIAGLVSVDAAIGVYDGSTVTCKTYIDIPSLTGAQPYDLMIKDSYLYVANYKGSGINSQILQLDPNSLTLTGAYGQEVAVPDTSPGHFYGPHRFLATLNRKIYIADDNQPDPCYAKIVEMDNINGDNWVTYGEHGHSGVGFFDLWCNC